MQVVITIHVDADEDQVEDFVDAITKGLEAFLSIADIETVVSSDVFEDDKSVPIEREN